VCWTKYHRIVLPAFQFPLSSSDSLFMLWDYAVGLVISLEARRPRNCVSIPGTSITFFSSRKDSDGLTPTTPSLLFNGHWTLFPLEQCDRGVKLNTPIPSNAEVKISSVFPLIPYMSLLHFLRNAPLCKIN